MTCSDKTALMMWSDGELSGSEADKISDHVASCSDCRNFINTQKQMESVWRDAWVDPGDSNFETMRGNLKPQTPWWRTQRTWYIAAALCMAYIGVKKFYLDSSSQSLADIALKETSVPALVAEDDVFTAPDEAPAEEMVVSECEEQELDISVSQDETVSGQPETIEVIEELSVDLALSAGDSESYEREDVVEQLDFCAGYSEGSVNTMGSDQLLDSRVVSDLPAAVEEITDELEMFRSVSSSSSSGSESSESADYGVAEGILSGGTGGGGSSAQGLGGISLSQDTDDHSDVFYEDMQSASPVESEVSADTYSLLITTESKKIIPIQRFQWDSLFSLIDSIDNDNRDMPMESFVFTVTSDGIVSGADIPVGTVIDLPETGYGDCSVTVLFH